MMHPDLAKQKKEAVTIGDKENILSQSDDVSKKEFYKSKGMSEEDAN
mgnify:CR=1 FL=1